MSKDTETDNTTENATTTTGSGSLGALLREYREQANLDVQSVAQALRLPVSAVEALENENFSELPEPPYVRGYLRSYSRLADADPQQSIAIYEALRGNESKKQTRIPTAIENTHYSPKNPPAELISPFRFKMGLLTLGILGLIVFSMIPAVQEKASSIWSSFSPDKEEQAVEETINTTISDNVAGNLPVSEPLQAEQSSDNAEGDQTETEAVTEAGATADSETSTPGETGSETSPDNTTPESSDTESVASVESEETTAEDSASEETLPNTENTETPATDVETATEEENTLQGNTKLKLVFSDEVWIRINDGEGQRLYEALNPAGTEKELSLNKPLKFKIGNAQGVKLFVDGKETDIQEYIQGSVARFGLE